MPYSRDELVSELTSYYKFIVDLYLPVARVKHPPVGGWPELTKDFLAPLNKNDAVVDLIQHLPYVGIEKEDLEP